MKDIKGVKISLGDEVAYVSPKYNSMKIGHVVGFTGCMVKISETASGRATDRKYPSLVVVTVKPDVAIVDDYDEVDYGMCEIYPETKCLGIENCGDC